MARVDRTLPVEPPYGHRWNLIPTNWSSRYEYELRLDRLDGAFSGLMTYLVRAREVRKASERIIRDFIAREHRAALAERVNRGTR